MTLKESLLIQFKRVIERGWLAYFNEFSKRYDFPLPLLLAIASRETSMKDIRGDFRTGKYHGYGIMQVDIGTDPVWCSQWATGKVRESIERGTQILKGKFTYLANHGLVEQQLTDYGIAAYNGGEGNALKAFNSGKSADSFTTGKNYSTDVKNRMKIFSEFLDKMNM